MNALHVSLCGVTVTCDLPGVEKRPLESHEIRQLQRLYYPAKDSTNLVQD